MASTKLNVPQTDFRSGGGYVDERTGRSKSGQPQPAGRGHS
jgi:hypothetical protein